MQTLPLARKSLLRKINKYDRHCLWGLRDRCARWPQRSRFPSRGLSLHIHNMGQQPLSCPARGSVSPIQRGEASVTRWATDHETLGQGHRRHCPPSWPSEGHDGRPLSTDKAIAWGIGGHLSDALALAALALGSQKCSSCLLLCAPGPALRASQPPSGTAC